jgi:hypothetical protein
MVRTGISARAGGSDEGPGQRQDPELETEAALLFSPEHGVVLYLVNRLRLLNLRVRNTETFRRK